MTSSLFLCGKNIRKGREGEEEGISDLNFLWKKNEFSKRKRFLQRWERLCINIRNIR